MRGKQPSKNLDSILPNNAGQPKFPTITLHAQANTIRDSFEHFGSLVKAAPGLVVLNKIHLPEVEDQFARFMIWGRSLGAFQDPSRLKSLDYRLRDAPHLRRSLFSILNHLHEFLNEGKLCISL